MFHIFYAFLKHAPQSLLQQFGLFDGGKFKFEDYVLLKQGDTRNISTINDKEIWNEVIEAF